MATYLAKVGELTLKGTNIKDFEQLLVRNTKKYLEKLHAAGKKTKVTLRAGRMYVECEDDEESCQTVEFCLNHLIGIVGWAKTRTCERTLDAIKEAVMEEAKIAASKGCKTFKIDARRSWKEFPLNSYQLCCEAAGPVESIMKVDVHNPDVMIYIEVRETTYVYSTVETGCRGLPVGSSNRGLLLLSGGLDSPVAGYRMMRRGMRVEAVYFHSYPYTSEEAQKKVETLAEKLSYFGINTYLNIIPFTDVQMRIKEKAPEAWSTLMLRVCMMKVANMVAERVGAECIITGESLGQVASQTLENMSVTEHFAAYPLLRPLVGMDKEEIIKDAYFIDTYETSILPYEDCCVLFSPKHPVLRGRIEDAERIFESLDCEELLKESFEKRDVKRFTVEKVETNE